MHQRKSKKILIYFLLLIIVSTISNNSLNSLKFSKNKIIKISGLDQKDNQALLNNVKNLNIKNFFFTNKNQIINLFHSNSLIESFEVFIKYPSTMNIDIKKTNFLAKINYKGKIYLIGSNGKLINTEKEYSELPFVFGKPTTEEFLRFKDIIDNSKFKYDQIENLYFFPSKRWDLQLKENILLKLPNNLTNKTLNHVHEFLENYIEKNLTIVDFRIENQIILNE